MSMNLGQKVMEDFNKQLFTSLPMPHPLQIAIEDAKEPWIQFATLPQEIKDAFILPEVQVTRNIKTDNGYRSVLKNQDGRTERKELFHFSPSIMSQISIKPQAKQLLKSTPEVKHFIEAARELNYQGTTYVCQIFESLDHLVPGISQAFATNNDYHPTRFLLNHPSKIVDPNKPVFVVTNKHPDRCGATAHYFGDETRGPLQGYNFEGEWVNIEKGEGEMGFFPGRKMQFYTSKQRSGIEIPGLWHRVPRTEIPISELSDKIMIAMVQFFHTDDAIPEEAKGLRMHDLPFGYFTLNNQKPMSSIYQD